MIIITIYQNYTRISRTQTKCMHVINLWLRKHEYRKFALLQLSIALHISQSNIPKNNELLVLYYNIAEYNNIINKKSVTIGIRVIKELNTCLYFTNRSRDSSWDEECQRVRPWQQLVLFPPPLDNEADIEAKHKRHRNRFALCSKVLSYFLEYSVTKWFNQCSSYFSI